MFWLSWIFQHMDNIYVFYLCTDAFIPGQKQSFGCSQNFSVRMLFFWGTYQFSLRRSRLQIQQPNFAQEHATNREKEGKPFWWTVIPTWHHHCNEPSIDLRVIILLSFATIGNSVVITKSSIWLCCNCRFPDKLNKWIFVGFSSTFTNCLLPSI